MSPITLDDLPKPTFGDPRQTSLTLHRHLRALIIADLLPGGTILKQSQLADVFGVSRTPLREAFRMLQEEGLIDTETNYRARVRTLDGDELDQLYGVRICLESLGARITAGRLTAPEIAHAHVTLRALEEAREAQDLQQWLIVHRQFHGLCTARAGEPLARVITSYSERSDRYLHHVQVLHPDTHTTAHADHEAILAAIVAGHADLAGSRMAAHLARTSLRVLEDVAPGAPGIASRTALTMANSAEISVSHHSPAPGI